MRYRSLALVAVATAALSSPTVAVPLATAAPLARHACSASTDIESFSDVLDKTTFHGVPVAEVSGLAVDRDRRLLAVADESHLFTLDADGGRVRAVRALADEHGLPLDSEAVAVDRDGTRLVASETGPAVLRFSPSGKPLGRLAVPDELQVAPVGRAVRNQTFEGIALLSDGRTLVASMEGALAGDQAEVRRLQTWHRDGPRGDFEAAAQYAVRADRGLTISDITATPDGRLIVLERGYTAGVGNTVRLQLVDPRTASDVRGVDVLDGSGHVRFARKVPLADIADCPSLGATSSQPQPNPLLDNVEGVTVTGRTADGRLRLLMVSDDNQNADQKTRLYSFSVRLPRR
ncbi:lipoprotein [Streptomyces viridiviolaceus]|uniref:Esterase-like activity of phytase family protein n=1 Tax=Streptomyces viridiviolaceus TaxID=68282 RepID=A0ABW2E9Y2_9ACTN|nr:esterase-like activity of phytase family protein [Streptomyces viridiviolaceus]GHB80539.1 lipoprotein [Streptomyces viridiviolaceus]